MVYYDLFLDSMGILILFIKLNTNVTMLWIVVFFVIQQMNQCNNIVNCVTRKKVNKKYVIIIGNKHKIWGEKKAKIATFMRLPLIHHCTVYTLCAWNELINCPEIHMWKDFGVSKKTQTHKTIETKRIYFWETILMKNKSCENWAIALWFILNESEIYCPVALGRKNLLTVESNSFDTQFENSGLI